MVDFLGAMPAVFAGMLGATPALLAGVQGLRMGRILHEQMTFH
jgi:hypothetical protein